MSYGCENNDKIIIFVTQSLTDFLSLYSTNCGELIFVCFLSLVALSLFIIFLRAVTNWLTSCSPDQLSQAVL